MRAEGLRQIVAVECHASVPSWIKGLCEEHSIASTNDGLLVHGIGEAEPRGKSVLPGLLWIIAAEAGISATRAAARKGKPSRDARSGINTGRVEEREMVVLLARCRVVIPAHAKIQCQFGSYPPGVIPMERPDNLAWIPRRHGS